MSKTPAIEPQVQSHGLLQLRVLKKELQAFYKQLLTTTNTEQLEKSVNDMIFNVNDAIQEVELS